jgi:translation initiation factor 2 alpha subunit (eIF-2alpha)
MLYTKDGFPEVNEIVLCEVTKIYGNSTFVQLLEYEKEGVLTISEIAPGRIRNLRDHVVENKVIVCKVLRVDPRLNRIDVSLRRVPIIVMKDKQEQIKKEEYSERIYMDVAKEVGSDKDLKDDKELEKAKDTLFENTYEPIFEEYETVYDALYDIMIDNSKLDMFTKIDQKTKDAFLKIINERIKPEQIVFKETFSLKSTAGDGVVQIKNVISECLKPLNYDKFIIIYTAAGEFGVTVTHDDMKSAQKLFDTFRDSLVKLAKEKKMILKITE